MSKGINFIPLRKAPQTPIVAHLPEQRSETFLACSLLLEYPEDNWSIILRQVREQAHGLPKPVSQQLAGFCDWADKRMLREVQEQYVETFDRKRRCALELTYHTSGDTRQRGLALTIFADLYAAVGFTAPRKNCLPDYLPRVLELAARTSGEDLTLVEGLISANREGIEILHAALISLDSPWTQVVTALRMALPETDAETTSRIHRLIRQGPPTELVGLDGPQDLPWPSFKAVKNKTTQGEQ